MQALIDGKADFAAIDAVSFELARQNRPELAQVKVLQETASCPGLPYVTSSSATPEQIELMRSALKAALEDMDTSVVEARRKLLISDISFDVGRSDYNLRIEELLQASIMDTAPVNENELELGSIRRYHRTESENDCELLLLAKKTLQENMGAGLKVQHLTLDDCRYTSSLSLHHHIFASPFLSNIRKSYLPSSCSQNQKSFVWYT